MSVATLWLAMLGGFGLALPVLLWYVCVAATSWAEVAEMFGVVMTGYALVGGLLSVLLLLD